MFSLFNNRLNNKCKFLLAALLFLFLSCLFFAPGFFGGKIIWGPDTPKIIYPVVFILDEAFKNFKLPLWLPDIYFGFPISAEGQFGLFYPPNLLHIFLPLQQVLLFLTIFHFFLAGFFAYLFSRKINLSYLASIFVGITFMFNGFIIAHLQYPHHIYAYPYLPLILLLIELAKEKTKIFYFALAGVSLGLQLLTGHPNLTIMTSIIVFLYILIGFWRQKLFLLKSLSILTFAFILISLPYLIQLIPLSSLSVRGGGTNFADATNSSFSMYDFITFLFPNFFFQNLNNSWVFTPVWHFWGYWGQLETTGYLGIITIFLALLAIFGPQHEKKRLFIFLLLVSLILALGKNTPVYGWLYNLPLFNGLRAPSRFLYLVDFSLAVLAGIGFHNLEKIVSVNKKRYLTLIFVLPLFTSIFILFAKCYLGRDPLTVFEFIKNHYAKLGFISSLNNPQTLIQSVSTSFNQQTIQGLILLLLTTLLLLTALIMKRKLLVLKLVMIAFLVLDLFLFAKNVNLWQQESSLRTTNNKIILRLKEELNYRNGRIYTFSNFWSDLMPNQLIPYHIPEADGFASLPVKRFERWQKLAESQWQKGDYDLFRSGSIKYVYGQNKNQTYLTPIDDSLPRAYITNSWVLAEKASDALKLLNSDLFNPKTVIVETGNGDMASQFENPKIIPVEIIRYQPELIEIKVDSPTTGFLVLTDTNYPGWQAFVNGKRAKIYQANYLFRAIFLSPGENEIDFRYNPPYFIPSIIISTLAILSIILWATKSIL